MTNKILLGQLNNAIEGTGSPLSVETPLFVGQIYVDSTEGQKVAYISTGMTSNDWKTISLDDLGSSGSGGSVSWADILSKPNFSTVATSGSYNDLTNKPTIPTIPVNIVTDENYVHTDNNYTTDEKNKLTGLSNYTLPKASDTILGGVKIGANLTIDSDGVLSATTSSGGVNSNADTLDGKHASDFATSTQGSRADSAVQGVKVNGTSVTLDENKVADLQLSASNLLITDIENHFTSTNVEDALKEVFTFANDGKTLVANAVTNKGVSASPSDTFDSLATKIGQIPTTSVVPTDPYLSNRLLVWEDDFSGSILNRDKWGHIYGKRYAPDVIKQVYPDDPSQNVYIENNQLVLKAKRNNPAPDYEWSGAYVDTNNLFEFKYGRLEAKMKFSDIKGSYSTLWLIGANWESIKGSDGMLDGSVGIPWAKMGEIDIAERASVGNPSTTVHWDNNGTPQAIHFDDNGVDPTSWHIYAMEWTYDKLDFYVDDVFKYTVDLNALTVNGYNALRMPLFLIINSGASIIPNAFPDPTTNELQTLVDWVRIYAPVGETAITKETSIFLDNTSLNLNIGDTFLITPSFVPSNTSDKTIKWVSSNPLVATVYGGKIKALSSGSATITAISKYGKIATCAITIGGGTDTTAPTTPTGLVKTTATNQSISVSWNANAESDLAGYNVYKDGMKVNATLISGTNYTFLNLNYSTSYLIQVSAVDSTGNESGKASITISTLTPYVLDRFDRANSTTTLGTTETGQTYVYWPSNQSVTWGISNNKAYNVSETGTVGMAVADSGQANVSVSADITFSTNEGLVFRFVDESNFLGVRIASTGLSVFKCVADIITSFGVYNFTANVGQIYNLKAVTNGTSVKIYLDNVLVIDTTETTHQLATKVGIRQSNRNVSYGYFDNFVAL